MEQLEPRIREVGQRLLSHKSQQGMSLLSPDRWSQALLDKMMENERFRVAALRFTDVAPTLREDGEFMTHLAAYFGEAGGLEGFLGEKIPTGKIMGKLIAPIVRRNIRSMASTFIAGENLKDGIKTFEELHNEGLACSIDLLGEAVVSRSEAEAFTAAYHEAIEKIAEAAANWPEAKYPEVDSLGHIPRANVSVKLTALYEHVDPKAHAHSVHVLTERLLDLLRKARRHNTYVHVDMEQYRLIPITMEVFKNVLMHPDMRDWPHVGIVQQAYLKDAEPRLAELVAFAKERGTPFTVRLVKGAYWDYEQAYAEQMNWPCPVYNAKEETDLCYERMLHQLLAAFPHIRPAIGSHNARTLGVAIAIAEDLKLSKADLEFQVLNGMATPFRDSLRDMGYRVRQYCPVGEFIPGMSYLVRRLLENTANQSFLRMNARAEADTNTLLQKPVVLHAELGSKKHAFTNHPMKDFSREADRKQAEDALQKFKGKLRVAPVLEGKTLKGGKTHKQTCPWHTGYDLAEVTYATKAQAEDAVQSALKAREDWRNLGHHKRAEILDAAADIMSQRWDELFALQVYEAGKDWPHADADIGEAIDFLRYYAREARRLEDKLQPLSLWGESNRTLYEPRGVAAVIAPWNFPLAISTGMTAAALVTGNPTIYKPAEQTCATGQLMCEIFHAAGVSKNALSFLPGDGAEVGAHLVEHPAVDLIAFTGSREVGLKILEAAGKIRPGQRNIKKCVIEMGGKNAIIVDSNADLDEAVPAIVASAFGFQGQKCSAASRVIVVGSAYEPLIARLADMVSDLRVGPASDPTRDVNAVIDAEAKAKVEQYIAIGEKDGKILAQAKNTTATGYFVPPTVVVDLKEGSRLTKEEVFGPILAVYKARSVEEAVNMAMDNDYALTGGLFSRNPKTIRYVREHFRVGNLYINRGITGALVSRQPFGGGAMSGTGTKAGGPDYLLNFVEPRVITENTMRRGYAPKPEDTDNG